VAANDIYELSSRQLLFSQQFINTIHIREVSASLTDTTRQSTLAIFADAFKDMLKTLQFNGLTYQTWRATQVQGSTVTYSVANCRKTGGRIYEGSHTGTLTGAQVNGNVVATYAAGVINERTGLAGRSRRGRIHIGGLTTNDVLPNLGLGSGPQSQYATAITTFRAGYGPVSGAADWEIVVWSRRIATGCSPATAHPHALTSQGDANPAEAWKPVTSMALQPAVGTMVRRKMGVGA
jgi:hypothetical protein